MITTEVVELNRGRELDELLIKALEAFEISTNANIIRITT